jgi:hypothetical protein
MYFVTNVAQLINDLSKLLQDKFIFAVDGDTDEEYVIDGIGKRKLHTDDDTEWCYALKIKKSSKGCIKR